MRIHLFAGARKVERASYPLRKAYRGQGVANLTLPYLAAIIGDRHQVTIQDEQSAPLDLDAPMDLAMITAKTCYAPRAFEIAEYLRHKGIPTIIGGCHTSLNPVETSQHCDCTVTGESEALMPELLADAERGRLKPLYRGEPVAMERVPWPRRDLLQKKYLIDAMVVSRGCNYTCSFCCIRNLYGNGFRGRPIGDIVREINGLGPRLGFLDENLVADRDFARELFTAMIPLGRRWLAQVSADIIREPELIRLAGKAGALGFHFGLETINPENLKAVNKVHNDVNYYKTLVAECHHAGILVAAGILFGLEGDTLDTFPKTIEIMEAIGADLCYFKIATPYPGTDFFSDLDRQGRILTRDWQYYDGFFPTFRPRRMTPRQLFDGVRWCGQEFYSLPAITKRIRQYTKLRMPLWASLNMNRMSRSAFEHARIMGERLLQEVGS